MALKYIVKRWILLRMAAEEFSFKEPFVIKNEYPIMKSILFLSLVPIELIFIFTYARIYGSLAHYTFRILLIIAAINYLISYITINSIKDKPFINETISSYEQMDYESRKKLYSFKNGATVLFLTLLPWILLFIVLPIVCHLIPRA